MCSTLICVCDCVNICVNRFKVDRTILELIRPIPFSVCIVRERKVVNGMVIFNIERVIVI